METARLSKKGYEHCEVPLVASTSMDWFLSKEGSEKAIQSRRLHVRGMLGLAGNVHLTRHSLGRYGSYQLEVPSVLMCLLTDLRWHGVYTTTVGNSFAAAGLADFVSSKPFAELTAKTAEAVRKDMVNLAVGLTLPMVVNRSICRLTEDELFQSVARDYSSVVRRAVDALASVERHTGHVVWVDGHDALVSLEVGVGGEEETRLVDADYLVGMGIDTDGQPLVAIDQYWSPDTGRVSYYQPAVVISHEDPAAIERLDRLLREAEKPPPRERKNVAIGT